MSELLPIHGFVLAGGKSSRMGVDKALLTLQGKRLVEIAVEKLRSFCSDVSIAGNREDLAQYAAIAPEERLEIGPVAGLEAGLIACTQQWAMFVPVDVPLVSAELLRNWAKDVLGDARGGTGASLLRAQGARQPAFCLIHRDCLPKVTATIERGERRINSVLDAMDANDGESWLRVENAVKYAPGGIASDGQIDAWFHNVNTPEEFAVAQMWEREVL